MHDVQSIGMNDTGYKIPRYRRTPRAIEAERLVPCYKNIQVLQG